mgnify:CR=1 FL=1
MDDKIETSNANGAKCASGCESGCCCSSKGISKKWKMVVCLIVAIAAAIVLANSILQKAEAQNDPAGNSSNMSLWDEPVASLASLNQVASQKDVFLYLPSIGQGPDDTVKAEIESTAIKAQSQGQSIAFFALDEGSEDYGQLTGQVPPPFVLVIAKGSTLSAVPSNITEETGMSIVSDISEENLLYALVAASRPAVACCSLPSTKCC